MPDYSQSNLSRKSGESSDAPTQRFHWIMKDAIVLACIGVSFFLFLVLFSYNGSDPGFETASSSQNIQNYGGRTGAWIASLLLYLFGLFGFLIPFGIFMAGMVTLKIRSEGDTDYLHFGLSLTGLILLIVSGSALSTLFLSPDLGFLKLPYSGGGVLGYEVSNVLVSAIDLLGTTLFLLVIFAVGISLFTQLSWMTILDKTGQISWVLINKVKPHLQALWGNVSSKTEGKASADSSFPVIASRNEHEQKVRSPLVGKLAEKVKTKTLAVLEKPQEKMSTAADHEIAIGDELSESSASLKVGRKASSNITVPVHQGGDLPGVDLLDPIPDSEEGFSSEELTSLSFLLEQRLEEFGVSIKVEAVQPGPVVTRFEVLPAAGVKVSQISNLAKDLARVLSVKSVRVVDVIPGKAVVGIEIPNEKREVVSFREVISSEEFQTSKSPLTVALGKDISGKPVVADIAKMPHLLVAGTTGSGKSVGVNSMILSLLYKSTPEEVRLIMVDPKMLELSIYEDIPHLLTPVVTDMSEAANALRWSVFEMDRRYQLMAKLGVRNIAGFNAKVRGAIEKGEPLIDPLYQQAANFGHELGEKPPTLEPLPFIVVVVDEFADMIMVVGKEVEQLIARIAQKARAAGIHLILATQRPSVNVITGLIKANIPTRISFMVNTKIDSRTILDQGGAEQLLGMGDMLFMPPGSGNPRRVHGAFMTDEEVHRVADFVKSQGEPQYLESITQPTSADGGDLLGEDAEQDLLYDQVVSFVTDNQRVSVSLVQRHFKIGYNRAARIVEAMESSGVVSSMKSNGNRDVLAPKSPQ
ncbi:DNA translocase FtsK [Hydrogenovibrio marinus]|uniref:DNA translocase FtsK n=1 Tax=Hydrogenovibrio marinus TaxID=28885 RepID=A0A066ZRC9_HYDMR|nr:DNA translocase FtsK [Hydrogenovibrio marinus]KDN94814.1 cell division protein FtsK [Hydrogenovibrio marinus]